MIRKNCIILVFPITRMSAKSATAYLYANHRASKYIKIFNSILLRTTYFIFDVFVYKHIYSTCLHSLILFENLVS